MDSDFNVFISWSKQRSKAIGQAFKRYLPFIVPTAKPWLSEDDLSKGGVWTHELAQKLGSCPVAIVIITPENLTSPWLMFEAGAIFKGSNDRQVCVVLAGVDGPLTGPMGLFQATNLSKEDLRRLWLAIAVKCDPDSETGRVSVLFEKFWTDLEDEISAAMKNSTPEQVKPDQAVVLEEMVSLVRSLQKQQEALTEAIKSSASSGHVVNDSAKVVLTQEVMGRFTSQPPTLRSAIRKALQIHGSAYPISESVLESHTIKVQKFDVVYTVYKNRNEPAVLIITEIMAPDDDIPF